MAAPFRSFRDARAFARKLKLQTQREWLAFCIGALPRKGKRPKDIPTIPHKVYKDKGWKSYGDWLGTGTVSNHRRTFRSFRDARAFARRLRLRSETEWRAFCRGEISGKGERPRYIPSNPGVVYKNKGWKGVRDWLGR